MKTKKEIDELAKEVANIEKQILKQGLDKIDQSLLHRIENIMEGLNLKEGLELNDTVIKILENN